MSAGTAMLLALAVPALGAVAIGLTGSRPNLREGVTLTCAVALLLIVAGLVPTVAAGARPEVTLLEMLPGLAVRFELEPLGMVFAGVAALLWPLNSIYSIGYMRGNAEGHQTRFYVCFANATPMALQSAIAKQT